jgi:hypothetical protein
MACPGSVALSRPYDGRRSVYAAEGTVVHALAAASLVEAQRAPVGSVLEADGIQVVVTPEMDDAIDVYRNYVTAIRAQADWHAFEKKVTIWSAPPGVDCYGTADFAAISGRVLDVVDLKYGKGVAVDAENNSQALFYALAVYETIVERAKKPKPIDLIRITIVQPRRDGGQPKTWEIDLVDLFMWRDSQLLPAIDRIVKGDKTLTEGDWCRFCPALAYCPAKHQSAQELARAAFDGDNSGDLTLTDLSDRLALAFRLEDYFVALKQEVETLIRTGESVPGWKLVEGRSNRKWSHDDTEVVRAIAWRTQIDPDRLVKPLEALSPAQMEKQVKRLSPVSPAAAMQDLVVKPPGKPVLAPETDERPAMTFSSAREAFEASAADSV